MLRSPHCRSSSPPRGAVLLIVLALLTLLMTLGLVFASVARLEGEGARSFRRSIQANSPIGRLAHSNVPDLLRFGVNQLIFDTDNPRSALRGHSLLRDMYGGEDAGWVDQGTSFVDLPDADRDPPHVRNRRHALRGVFNGTGIFLPRDNPSSTDVEDKQVQLFDGVRTVTWPMQNHRVDLLDSDCKKDLPSDIAYFITRLRPPPQHIGIGRSQVGPDNVLNPIFPINFTVFDPVIMGGKSVRSPTQTYGGGSREYPSPEKYAELQGGKLKKFHYYSYDEDYDAADVNNMFLCLERADGTVIQPSFHRPHLIRQVEQSCILGSTQEGVAWTHPDGRNLILRPRQVDRNLAVMQGRTSHPNDLQDIPDVDGSTIRGDSPAELDVDSDGDGIKDSVWIDLGHPQIDVGGKKLLPLFAFKVIDLDSKINLNTAGKFIQSEAIDKSLASIPIPNLPEMHRSNLGASVAEINPKHALLIRADEPDQAPDWLNPVEYKRLFVGHRTQDGKGTRGKWNPARTEAPDNLLFAETDPGPKHSWHLRSRPNRNEMDDDGSVIFPRGNPSQYILRDYVNNSPAGMLDWHGVGTSWAPSSVVSALCYSALGFPNKAVFRVIQPSMFSYAGFGFQDWNEGVQFPPRRAISASRSQEQSPSGPNQQALSISLPWNRKPVPNHPFWNDEAEELDHYQANPHDSPFTVSEIERLLCFRDIVYETLDRRLEELLPENLRSESPPAGRTGSSSWRAQTQGWSEREYARLRMRRMFTHASWDLTRYNIPPTYPVNFANQATGPFSEDFADSYGQNLPTIKKAKDGESSGDAPRGGGNQGDGNEGDGDDDPQFFPNPPVYTHDGVLGNIGESGQGPTNMGNVAALTLGIFGKTTNSKWTHFGNRYPTEVFYGQRFDLNRPLTPYSDPANPNASYADPVLADKERTDLAEQLFTLLYLAARPNTTQANSKEVVYMLGQIAVNMVDYMDSDGVMTIMEMPRYQELVAGSWVPSGEYVIGFELPELVINEAYACAWNENDSTDKVWWWTELRNPWPNTFDSSGTRIPTRSVPLFDTKNNESIYKLRVVDETAGGGNRFVGNYDFNPTNSTPAPTIETVSADDGKNGGLYLYGPRDPHVEAMPPEPKPEELGVAGWASDLNSYTSSAASAPNPYQRAKAATADPKQYRLHIDLMKKRNPYAPSASHPTSPDPKNPYIHFDYVDLNGYGADPDNPDSGYCWHKVADMPEITSTKMSIERRQPWVGQGRRSGWKAATNKNAYNSAEMGKLLGYPKIDPAAGNIKLWTANKLPADKPVDQYAGFAPSIDGSGNTFHAAHGERNSRDAEAYLSFPFLNRALATPLELLSLRIYGCSYYSDLSTFETTDADAFEDSWHLRFMDDFEVLRRGDKPIAAPIRNRVAPWFDVERPSTAINRHADDTLSPLPRLYRFFEFVECRSRMKGAGSHGCKWNDGTLPPGFDIPSQDIDVYGQRALRIPGKINLNTLTEEEVFRALIDETEVMPLAYKATNVDRYLKNYPLNDWRRPMAILQSAGTHIDKVPSFGGKNPLGLDHLEYSGDDWWLANRQWPGIRNIPVDLTVLPGRDPNQHVYSELFRQFLLSRAGADGIHGTGDDKPFRSFAADRISDTLLRQRNFRCLDGEEGRPVSDKTETTPGDYIDDPNCARGQWAPRLFDPISDPFDADVIRASTEQGSTYRWPEYDPKELKERTTGQALDYWTAETRRNRLLAKIGANSTNRSHVFACWMTVGYFDVDRGMDSVRVPCIKGEVNLSEGRNIRHRCFFIVDRSLADDYDGPSTKRFEENPLLTLPNKITIIE